MTHLDESQLVDALDGRPGLPLMRHLAECSACRAQVEELRTTVASLQRVAADEPSPLFWEHFPQRVQAALDDADGERGPGRIRRWLPHALAWCGAGALAIALHLVATSPPRPAEPDSPPMAAALPMVDDDLEQDEAWTVIRALAEELDYESAHDAGVVPRAGSLDRVALELNAAERAELARLIDEELKRIGP
jgi:hypothetical protein